MTSLLYICSKCFTKHKFEDLSDGTQLCKECRGTFPIVKCTYCRSEFQQTSKGNTSAICKKCEQNVKSHGKPSACEYCNVIAAFIGSKCQRCTNSELKYGPAVTCDQCKQRSAFDRHDDSKKIDGKLLCWLCTLSFKRTLAKARQGEKDGTRIVKKRPHTTEKPQNMQHGHHKETNYKKPQRPDITKQVMPDIPEKVARIVSSMDSNNSDHFIAMTELKETIANMQKRLSQKDRELLEKDKMITELKAKHFTSENEIRNKMKDSDRLFEVKLDILNKKIASLLKDVAVLTKSNKRAGNNLSKDSGGSGTDSPIAN